MNWGSAAAFFAMGGYGGYVWGSYAMATLCIAVEIVLLAARHRRLRDELRRG